MQWHQCICCYCATVNHYKRFIFFASKNFKWWNGIRDGLLKHYLFVLSLSPEFNTRFKKNAKTFSECVRFPWHRFKNVYLCWTCIFCLFCKSAGRDTQEEVKKICLPTKCHIGDVTFQDNVLFLLRWQQTTLLGGTPFFFCRCQPACKLSPNTIHFRFNAEDINNLNEKR